MRVHGLEQRRPVGGALVLDLADQAGRPRVVTGSERVRVLREQPGEDVGVAHPAEQTADPMQLLAQGFAPRPIEDRSERPQVRPQPAGGDPGLVDALRVLADPDDRVGGDQTMRPVRERGTGEILDRAPAVQRRHGRQVRRRVGRVAEHATDLRAVAVGLRPGRPQALHAPWRRSSGSRRRPARTRPRGTARRPIPPRTRVPRRRRSHRPAVRDDPGVGAAAGAS